MAFADMNTCILIEGRNFKTFVNENYAIALESYYLFSKKMFENDIDSALRV